MVNIYQYFNKLVIEIRILTGFYAELLNIIIWGVTLVTERVKELIADQLGLQPDDITPESSFVDDLGADSLDLVELLMAFSEEFDVEISDEEAETIETVEDVLEYLRENE